MIRFLPILVVLFLGYAAAQDDGISACSAGCISQVFSDTTSLSCPANDKLCACNNSDFWFAVRDCITQACGLTGDALTEQLADAQTSANSQCDAVKASATAATTAPTSTTSVPATNTPAASTTSPNTSPITTTPTTSTSSSSSTAQATTSTAPTTSPAATSTLKTSATSSQSSAAGHTSASSLSSSTAAASATAGSTSASSTDASSSDTESSTSSDLGVAAKAGIGAGAGVALLLSAIIACYILSKKRKAKQGPSRIPTMQISKPLPGSGRQYAHDVEAAKVAALSTHFRNDYPSPIKAAKYSPSAMSSQYSPRSMYAPSRPSRDDDPDVLGRRYEDMVPRTKPRTMV